MSETNDHGFITTSTARTEATEAAVKSASVVNAESKHENASDENFEESAISKQTDSDDDLDDESIDSDDADDDAQGEQKPRKNGLKKRFSKLTQAKKLAEGRAAQLEAELAQLRQGNKPQEEKPHAQTQKASEGEPDPADFDTHLEFLKAFTKWDKQQTANEAAAEKQKADALERSSKAQSSYDEKVAEFKKTKPDFQEVIDQVIPLVHSQKFLEAVVSSEFGPQIAYELAQNPKEIVRLQTLDAESLNRALGRLEAKFESGHAESSEEKTIKKTNAPRPISPVGQSSTSQSKALNDPKINFAEYERERLKQLNKK